MVFWGARQQNCRHFYVPQCYSNLRQISDNMKRKKPRSCRAFKLFSGNAFNKNTFEEVYDNYFNSSTTTDAGGSFTCKPPAFTLAPLNAIGLILSGF